MAALAFGQSAVPDVPEYFVVGFEQNGQLVPIKNHQVLLEKKSFSIVIYFKEPGSVLVNASFTPESFETAKAEQALKDIPGFSDLGMAEEPFNPKTLLMMSKTAPHYWYYEHQGNHRFNDVQQKNGVFVCRRIIAQIMDRDSTRTMRPVMEIAENGMYLVFMRTDWTRDFSQQIEKQRDYVTVIFR